MLYRAALALASLLLVSGVSQKSYAAFISNIDASNSMASLIMLTCSGTVGCELEQPPAPVIPGFWEGQGDYSSTVREKPQPNAPWQSTSGNVNASWNVTLGTNAYQFDFSAGATQAGSLDYASYLANNASINFSLAFTLHEESTLLFSGQPGTGTLALESNSNAVFSRGADGDNGLTPALLGAGDYELFYNLDVDDMNPAGTGSFSLSLTPSSAVPVPAAAWLFGSALLALIGRRRFAR